MLERPPFFTSCKYEREKYYISFTILTVLCYFIFFIICVNQIYSASCLLVGLLLWHICNERVSASF